MGIVYILKNLEKNASHQYYVGSTNNLERRLREYQLGKNITTKGFKDFELVFSQELSTLREARQIEYWLKRQKKKGLVERIITDGKITKNGCVV